MGDKSISMDENRLPAEDLANEERLENRGENAAVLDDPMGVDDWDGISPGSNEVSLESLREGEAEEAANDNWDDNDDNAFNDSDDALPDDSEEAAINQDLLDTTERGRFGDGA
ncbi:MAG: hypothetical protein DI629_11225 [Mesorhizobium amorphae]|nr:MAG: hypothetical protein DI629_11225 [Mesorhizobium amorphae]